MNGTSVKISTYLKKHLNMKSNFIYTFFCLAIMVFLFSSNNGGRATIGQANTGAPGDQVNGAGQPWTCQTCHGTGNANGIQVTQTFEITDADGNDLFANGYTPGETYDVKLTVNAVTGNPAKYGFQILCLNAAPNVSGPEVSNWTAVSSNVAIRQASTTGRTYAEHATGSSSNEFTMTWVAPAAGSGDVTFYAVGNGVNGNDASSGDGATTSNFTLIEGETSSAKNITLSLYWSLFPNPVATQLSVKVNADESGQYDWSIIDVQGRALQVGQFDLIQGENLQTVAVADIATGLYHFQMHKDGKITTQTLVKK
ncbi:MAG: hypothetical protein ACI8YQ_000034 [Polaribacter sp.]